MCSFRSFYLFTCFSFRFQLQFSLFFSVYFLYIYIFFCCWPTYQFELNDVAQSSYCFATTNYQPATYFTILILYLWLLCCCIPFRILLKRFQRFILNSDSRTVWMTVGTSVLCAVRCRRAFIEQSWVRFNECLLTGFLLVIKVLTNLQIAW